MPELNEDGVHVHIGSARTTGYRPNAVPASIRLCRRGTAGSAVSKLPVCHDVQQPLKVILAQTQMLQRQKSGRPRALLLAKSELVALTRQSVREHQHLRPPPVSVGGRRTTCRTCSTESIVAQTWSDASRELASGSPAHVSWWNST